MSLPYPHFMVNFKIYEGTAGEDGLELAEIADRVRAETGREIAVAPQTPDLRLVAENTDVPLVAQAVDPVEAGRGNGRILPEAVVQAGADGVLVNHPEYRETVDGIERILDRCEVLGLDAVVSVNSVAMGRAIAQFEPACLLFEKPEDVASGSAITRTDPDRVRAFVDAIEAISPDTRVLVGGGITEPEDVAAAFELGADAAGAASAFVGSDDPEAWLTSIAEAMPTGDG